MNHHLFALPIAIYFVLKSIICVADDVPAAQEDPAMALQPDIKAEHSTTLDYVDKECNDENGTPVHCLLNQENQQTFTFPEKVDGAAVETPKLEISNTDDAKTTSTLGDQIGDFFSERNIGLRISTDELLKSLDGSETGELQINESSSSIHPINPAENKHQLFEDDQLIQIEIGIDFD